MLLVCAGIGVAGAWWLAPWGYALTAAMALLALWGLWFFRDPERTPPDTSPDAVISPADGKVIKIDLAPLPAELRAPGGALSDAPMQRVSIFLNLFDVHVNRAVIGGTIQRIVYTPGLFVNASFDKASTHNERTAVLMTDTRGRTLAFSQIAGLVARRIVCHLREGQVVRAGERFGLIRFGSRAEIWMPVGARVAVQVGQRVRAGQTTLATLPPPEARAGQGAHAAQGARA
jgi:phosphatidylserine decarboxylase